MKFITPAGDRGFQLSQAAHAPSAAPSVCRDAVAGTTPKPGAGLDCATVGPASSPHPGKVPSAPVTWSWHQQQQGGPLSSIMETWRVGLSALLLTGNLGVIEGQRVACWVPGLKSCILFGIF